MKNENDKIDLQNRLLNLIMEMQGLKSDYQLAKYMQIPLQSIRNYRKHKSKMDDTMCLQIAEELKMEPLQIMARIRTQGTPTKRIERIWGRYLGRVLLAAGIAFASPQEINAQNWSNHFDQNIHYTHRFARWFRRLARTWPDIFTAPHSAASPYTR